MKIGSFTVEILSEGRFELFRDGHINRSSQKKADPTPADISRERNMVMVGINPVLIQSGDHNILLDTGLGWGLDAGSSYRDVSNILTNLAIFDIDPGEITHVILSHLHYDHAAGSSFTDEASRTRATFPNATYYVHQREWDFALEQQEADQQYFGADYELDDFYRLVADQQVEFLSGGSTEILDGITAMNTGGHTPGHQVVRIESKGEVAYFLADLVPTAFHLNKYAMNSADVHSVESKKQKVQLLKKVCNENALLLLYHSKFGQAGRLIRDNDKQYVLAQIAES